MTGISPVVQAENLVFRRYRTKVKALVVRWSGMRNTTTVSREHPCPAIDREHDIIMKAMAGLHNAVMENRSADVIAPLIELLGRFCTEHFANEEALLRQYEYAHVGAHAAAHEFLLRRVLALKECCVRGELPAVTSVMDLLRCLAEHTDIWDREAVHVIQQGIVNGAKPEAEGAETAMRARAS